MVFWVVTPCTDVVGYEHFRRACCLCLHPEDGHSYMVLQLRSSWLWNSKVSPNTVFICT